jgi:hypothetical protein
MKITYPKYDDGKRRRVYVFERDLTWKVNNPQSATSIHATKSRDGKWRLWFSHRFDILFVMRDLSHIKTYANSLGYL